jgi:hypothetical protein
VRANQEEKLKPYVIELENSIKQKLDRAKQAKEKQEEMLLEKLAEHTRYSRHQGFGSGLFIRIRYNDFCGSGLGIRIQGL